MEDSGRPTAAVNAFKLMDDRKVARLWATTSHSVLAFKPIAIQNGTGAGHRPAMDLPTEPRGYSVREYDAGSYRLVNAAIRKATRRSASSTTRRFGVGGRDNVVAPEGSGHGSRGHRGPQHR